MKEAYVGKSWWHILCATIVARLGMGDLAELIYVQLV
jgi:hypothetical protein